MTADAILANARLSDAAAQRAATWMQSIPEQIGAGEFAGTRIAAVDETVADTGTIRLGGRDLRLSAVPRAHSGNALTVFDVQTGTLFAGDLIFQGLTPSLAETNGSVVNVNSMVVRHSDPKQGAYKMAKSALLAMTRSLAVEWGPHGIRSVAIAPGPFPTAGAGQALDPTAGRAFAASCLRAVPRPEYEHGQSHHRSGQPRIRLRAQTRLA